MRQKHFSVNLKNLRKEKNLSQDELAEQLDVSRTTIAKTESGRSIPKAEFVMRAYSYFREDSIVDYYVQTQKDKKELIRLAKMLLKTDYRIVRIVKNLVREALHSGDLQEVGSYLFQLIMWDLEKYGVTNSRKVDWLICIFKKSEGDSGEFLKLLNKLYDIAYSQKSSSDKAFDAFIKITEALLSKNNLNDQRLSQLLYQEATAYYYKGNHYEAYKLSSKAIEVINGAVYPHTPFAYHRHSLICLQVGNYSEALQHSIACLQITDTRSDLYKLVKAALARQYYLTENYTEAKKLWEEYFKVLDTNDVKRIHSLNDIIMMEIKLGNLREAQKSIRECERLLAIAKKEKWGPYLAENLLLKRNKIIFNTVRSGNYICSDVSSILVELEKSHMNDELQLTKNFILDRVFS